MDLVVRIVHYAMDTPAILGLFGFLLIVAPILGIMAVHSGSPVDKAGPRG